MTTCDHCHKPLEPDTEEPREWIHLDGWYTCIDTAAWPTPNYATVNGTTLVK
jgi:hypothetical protein